MKRFLVCLALLVPSLALADDIGFIEDFALAKDRSQALRKLIPGTEDYYYYHALHALNTEQFEKAQELTRPWLERYGQTARLTEIQTRYALLTYDRDPERTLNYLRNRLNLRFDHQKQSPGAAPNLPTMLDQKLIARSTLLANSLARWKNLDNFEQSALDWLAGTQLDWERRRFLLQRLERPDIPNLAEMIAEDFKSPHPVEFGKFPIHQQLTLAQMAELLKLRPELLNQTAFVRAWIAKLQPGADEDWRHDKALTRAYLDRLLGFVRQLAPAHNALKAHVLYHRLVLDRSEGKFDRALFLEYLKLPRQQPYMSKTLLEADLSRRYPADLNVNFEEVTLLHPVGSDEPLVRAYLQHFFVTDNSPSEFEPYINDIYVRQLFAETKIEQGLGESEQWASQLPPEVYRQFKDRIDIDFAATNKTHFAADEPVRLDLHIKNVQTLLVRVFEINAQSAYRLHQREIDTDINLDGLVANAEETHTYTEPATRRMDRRFEFPQLKKSGVYVIDFIGSGKSSRALVRKGRLRPIVSTTSAGQSITVIDEANRPVKDTAVWLGGQEYKAETDGKILIPFSTSPGMRPIVLSHGDFASLDHLQHLGESYELKAGIHVEREALLTQRIAQVLVRPGLFLDSQPISVKLLEEVKLLIRATDQEGIATSTEVPNFKLYEDRESVHEFRVPPRLASLHIELRGEVKSLSQNQKIACVATADFGLNGIAKTDKIEDLHFAKFGKDYVIELLDRTGLPKPDRAVQLALKHRDFRELVRTTLKTDEQGRVHLGPLADIVHVTATGPEGISHSWAQPLPQHTYRQLLHARAGETIALPYLGSAAAPSRTELALFEMRGALIERDRFTALAIRDGALELRDLPAGDYDLWLKQAGERIRIRVADGTIVGRHILGKLRQLELPLLKPVQIASIATDNDLVTIRLRDASPYARVHIFATRYDPAFSAFGDLSKVRDTVLQGVYPAHADSVYLTGRNIGDEYRYVLDRKQQRKHPGNQLEQPGLLLNPWAVRSTETGEQQAAAGGDFSGVGAAMPTSPAPTEMFLSGKMAGAGLGRGATEITADLNFLAESAAVLVNLTPDKDGVIKVERKQIGAHNMIHVVAVDPLTTTSRSVALPEPKPDFLDLRLDAGLDPKRHFTQQKQISILTPGQSIVLPDAASSRFEVYDSLPRVYALFATLNQDPKLAEFAFLLRWPSLKPEEKRTLYSKHACHELSFFLAKKDPAFFNSVVKPYLANKKDKTFLDRWLLEEDLRSYVQPWQYDRLNIVERILLAQRVTGEPAKTTRHLQDRFRLLPPDSERPRVLIETALMGRALSTELGISLERPGQNRLHRLEDAQQLQQRLRQEAAGAVADGNKALAAKEDLDAKSYRKTPADSKAGFSGANKLSKSRESLSEREASGEKDKTKAKGLKEEMVLRALNDADAAPFGEFPAERLRKQVTQLYRRLDATQEWAEDNYYHLPIQQQIASLVGVSSFWLDYAKHDGKTPFLSQHFADATHNFTEMMLALAVLDLPFSSEKHEVKFDGGKMSFTPAGRAVAFHEEVRPVAGPAGKVNILVSQNFYRHGDRFREEAGEKIDKFVTEEFVVHTVYGCQVVVTNPTSSRQRLSVLIQIPVGAIPVSNSQATRTALLDLEPYRTQTIDYLFYFPRPGEFAHFPVHVAKNEMLVASSAPFTFHVVAKPTKLDTESWDYISQNGTNEQVLAFLNRENVSALNLDQIAWRMKDKEFFNTIVQLLRNRHQYQPTLWS